MREEIVDETTVLFAPGVDLTPAEFVAAWNDGPGKIAHAPARVERSAAEQYDLAEVGFVVVSSIAVNLLSSLIYDVIKGVFAEKRRPPPPTLRVVVTPQPEGSTVVVVTVEG